MGNILDFSLPKNGLLGSGSRPRERTITATQRAEFIRQAGSKCLCCKGEKCLCCDGTCGKISDPTILEVHHIKAVAKGGTDKPWNISVLCPTCHRYVQKHHFDAPSLGKKPTRKKQKRRKRNTSSWSLI